MSAAFPDLLNISANPSSTGKYGTRSKQPSRLQSTKACKPPPKRRKLSWEWHNFKLWPRTRSSSTYTCRQLWGGLKQTWRSLIIGDKTDLPPPEFQDRNLLSRFVSLIYLVVRAPGTLRAPTALTLIVTMTTTAVRAARMKYRAESLEMLQQTVSAPTYRKDKNTTMECWNMSNPQNTMQL